MPFLKRFAIPKRIRGTFPRMPGNATAGSGAPTVGNRWKIWTRATSYGKWRGWKVSRDRDAATQDWFRKLTAC